MAGSMQTLAITAAIKAKARELGFDLVGVAAAAASARRDYFREWLDAGMGGEMGYLSGRFEERADPSVYLPDARSVVCVGMNYFVPLNAPPPGAARVARYALGEDYHEVIKSRLFALADFIREICPQAKTRCSVDTAPVMEKDLATRAGIGWQGKNTCVINEKIGSWILLGEVVTTAELTVDEPAVDRCGSCKKCIEACPTEAITEPYQLDARKCISYLTIEHRGEISAEVAEKIGEWIFGCDICQEVCPWNREPPSAADPALRPRRVALDPEDVLSWTDEDYRRELRGSAMKRVKLPMLKRNARIVAGNIKK
jgi:epoxyqueuosine reductase